MTEVRPTQAWNCRGFTPSICFISTAPKEPITAEATTNSRPADMCSPSGFHMTRTTPARVMAVPAIRRASSRSPSRNQDRTAVTGTPSWLTMATAEGLAVFRAKKTRAKVPQPMQRPTRIIRQRGRGTLRSQGQTTASTTAKRRAA